MAPISDRMASGDHIGNIPFHRLVESIHFIEPCFGQGGIDSFSETSLVTPGIMVFFMMLRTCTP